MAHCGGTGPFSSGYFLALSAWLGRLVKRKSPGPEPMTEARSVQVVSVLVRVAGGLVALRYSRQQLTG